jgi:hypothetical protein
VQQHVHAADAQHGVVEVEAVEEPMMEMVAQRRVVEQLGMMLPQVFTGRHKEAGGTARRVADDVSRLWCGELHHQPNDVPRRTELTVLTGRGDLGEHVLVHVALGVALLHWHLVEHVDHLGQQRRRRDSEARILHVVRVRRVPVAELTREIRPEEWKDVLGDDGKHLGSGEMLETRPAEVFERASSGVLTLGEDPPLHRPAEPVCLVFLERVHVVETTKEQQIRDLLDHFQRIGNAARPEGVPDSVDLVPDVTGNHVL